MDLNLQSTTPYASQQNLIDRFGEAELIKLTYQETDAKFDNDGNLIPPAINPHIIWRALTDACEFVDSYLMQSYNLSFYPAVPTRLVRITCNIARYSLYTNIKKQPVYDAYLESVAWLEDVRDGKLGLKNATPLTTTSSQPLTEKQHIQDSTPSISEGSTS